MSSVGLEQGLKGGIGTARAPVCLPSVCHCTIAEGL